MLVLLVLGAAAAVTVAVPRFRSVAFPRYSAVVPGAATVEQDRVPRAWHVLYREDVRFGREISTTTTEVWVRRPFDARQVSYPGPPRDRGRAASTQVWSFGRLQTSSRDSTSVIAVAPDVASPDMRPDRVLPDGIRRGVFEPREVRRVAGRACRVYRTGAAVETGLKRPEADGERWADVCFDAAGLMLEQVVVQDGSPVRSRTAIRVDEDPDLDPALFRTGEPTLTPKDGGGSVRRVTAASQPPGPFLEIGAPPEGFTHLGRYAVIPAQPGLIDPAQRSTILASIADIWVRGADALIVDRGGTLQRGAPFSSDPDGFRIDVGERRGELLLDLRSTTVRALLGGGRYLRVLGTLEPDDLIEVAERTREVTGSGELEFPGSAPRAG